MWHDDDAPAKYYEVVTADKRRHTLRPGERLTIGRHVDNQVVLDHPSVSRFHARIDWETGAPAPVIVDLGSLNGTFVGGARVLRSPLGEWTGIRVGSADLAGSLRAPALIPSTGGTLVRLFDEWTPDQQGTVDGPVAMQELLVALERNRRTVTVDLQAPDLSAVVVLAGGRAVRVTANELTGRDALRHLLVRAPRARYVITTEVRPFDGGTALSIRDAVRELAAPTTPVGRLLAS